MLRLESEVAREIEREIAISRPSSAQIGASAERGSEAEGATSAALVPAHLEASYRRHAKYRALYGEGGLWVRPYGMFCEEVVVDGRSVRRFAPIG